MKKNVLLILLAAFVMLCFTACNEPASEWSSDLEAAKTAAAENNKNILLVFGGTSWDMISAEVKSSILDTEAFRKAAGKKYELVFIDIPADEEPFADGVVADWYMAAMIYQLEKTPSYFLVDADGKKYASIEYDESVTTSKALIKLFEKEEKAKVRRVSLKGEIEKAQGIKKVKLIDELYELTAIEERSELIDYIKEVPELDPNNQTKLLGKYKMQLTYLDASACLNAQDFAGARDLFLSVTQQPDLFEPEYIQEAYYSAASLVYMMSQTGEGSLDDVVDLLEQSVAACPEGEFVEDVQYTLTQIKQVIEAGESTQPAEEISPSVE